MKKREKRMNDENFVRNGKPEHSAKALYPMAGAPGSPDEERGANAGGADEASLFINVWSVPMEMPEKPEEKADYFAVWVTIKP